MYIGLSILSDGNKWEHQEKTERKDMGPKTEHGKLSENKWIHFKEECRQGKKLG